MSSIAFLRVISVFSVAPRWILAAVCLLLAPVVRAQTPAALAMREGFPFTDESVHYSINWQSGLSLGDAAMNAHHSAMGWNFEVTLNAGVPGFALADKYNSATDDGICSQELSRELRHAGNRTTEKTTFDQKVGTATRVTLFPEGGGRSTYDVPSCARDALAFVYYARIELGQGRVPPAQQVFFGPPYTSRMDYGGARNITVDQKSVVTDRLTIFVKGPKSDFSFEVFFARDPARTPLRILIPAALGTFTLELVR